MTETKNRWVRGLALGIFTAMIAVAVGGVTDYVLFNIQIAMFFWLLNALAVVAGRGWPAVP